MESYLPQQNTPATPLNLDGAAYRLTWTRRPIDESPDLSGLPSLDYALYLYNTVKFHLGQLFRLIDEEHFLSNLNAFYQSIPTGASASRLWYVQYLLVLAFGKAFLVAGTASSTPVGSHFAARALSLLPEFPDIHGEDILEIEVLCLAALYLQSIDMRIAAFQYVSTTGVCVFMIWDAHGC